MVRLNKYLAECGIASRREADKLIQDKKVTINGRIAVPGDQVDENDEVIANGKKAVKDKTVILAYYKPVGVTCTEKDIHAEKNIIDELGYKKRVTYAGRLDKESEGLMIMTNDGDLIQKMMKGSLNHEKEYIVEVGKAYSGEFLDKLEKGVYLAELKAKTRPCKIDRVSEKSFRIILTQGMNRQIRRMCEVHGYDVKSLKRVRVMNIELGELKPGEYRELTQKEKDRLYMLANRKADKAAAATGNKKTAGKAKNTKDKNSTIEKTEFKPTKEKFYEKKYSSPSYGKENRNTNSKVGDKREKVSYSAKSNLKAEETKKGSSIKTKKESNDFKEMIIPEQYRTNEDTIKKPAKKYYDSPEKGPYNKKGTNSTSDKSDRRSRPNSDEDKKKYQKGNRPGGSRSTGWAGESAGKGSTGGSRSTGNRPGGNRSTGRTGESAGKRPTGNRTRGR